MDISPQHLLLSIIFGLIIGAWTSYLARFRGRDQRVWFVLGFCFGLIALIVLLILPDLTKKREELGEESVVADPIIPFAEEKEWYYLGSNDTQQGPVNFFDLKILLDQNKISSTSFVWSEGMEEWKTIEECSLFTN